MLNCNFCGKSADKCKRLIEGASKEYICDQCVVVCMEILIKEDDVRPFEISVSETDLNKTVGGLLREAGLSDSSQIVLLLTSLYARHTRQTYTDAVKNVLGKESAQRADSRAHLRLVTKDPE